jgi:Bacterial membrane protein YfhO
MSGALRVSRGLVLASLAAAVCVALRPLLSFDRVPVFRDLLLFIVPIKQFLGEHLRRGEIPFWNPWISLGSPFLAAMHMGVFYPPSALLLLPLPTGLNLFLLAHYLIALLGMWKLLNERGLGWASAALGSLTFAVGGYMISLLNIPKELHGAAWLPWALFFWTRWLRHAERRDLALTALSLALQILGGSAESMLMTVALLGAFALQAEAPSGRRVLRAAAGLVVVVAAAGALTAFQLLPTLEYASQSGRASPLPESEVFFWSLQPASLLQLVLPISAPAGAGLPSLGIGLERYPPMLESLYLGVPALCLVFAGMIGGREQRFWGLVLAVALVAALGSSTPLLPLLYRAAPELFGRLRYPEKFLLLFHVSAAVLAADGLAKLESGRHGALRAAMVAGIVLCFTGVGLWWLVRHHPRAYLAWLSWVGERTPTAIVPVAEALASQIGRLLMLAVSLVALLLVARSTLIGNRLACLALILLAAGDLVSVRWRSLITMLWPAVQATRMMVNVGELRESGQRVFHYTDAPADASSIGRFRLEPIRGADPVSQYLMPWSTLFANVPMVYGVHSVGGSDGFVRRDMKTFLDVLPTLSLDGAVRVVRAMGVAYMIGPSERKSSLLELVQPGQGLRPFIYWTRDPAPFVRLAERLDVEKLEADALARLARDDFDPRRGAVVAELPEGWTDASGASGPVGTAEVVSRKDELVEIRVHSPRERLLVINESDYPGWAATVDGRPAVILRTNGLLQGVRVPPGEHAVMLRFRPSGFRWGCVVAAATALAGLGLLGAPSRRRAPLA